MDRKMVGVLGAAVASAVAFLWWQSEDDDVEIDKQSYGLKGDDPKKTKHLMVLDSEEEDDDEDDEDDEDEEDEEDVSSISEEESENEEDDESTEEEKPKPSKKKSKSNSKR